MNSTSIHHMNADRGLRRPQRYFWFLVNWLNNNLFPNVRDSSLTIKDFVANISDPDRTQTQIKISPSRKLCDLFWLQLPWELIQQELGEINILDAGCGSGDYGVKLQSYSESRIANYTGVDTSQHAQWSVLAKIYPNFQFIKVEGANISGNIPDRTNLFISQSAIEHFEYDLLYFERIREFVRGASRSILQIHLLPSSACLKLYLYHGVRQYTPRTISYIARLFQGFSYSTLYRLGGRECNRLHWEFITKPFYFSKIADPRDTFAQEYDRKLRQAIAADNNKQHREPSFYALVIHSNWRQTIFK